MTKFCVSCGKELKDGICEDCKDVKAESKKPEGFTGMLKDFLEIVKGIITKPVDTLKTSCKEENFYTSLISIAVSGIAMGIFMMVFMKEVGPAILSALYGGYSLLALGSYDVEYVKIFIYSFIAIVVLIFATASVSYLVVDKILKGKTSIKKMISVFGFSSIILSVGLLLGAICLFINFTLALIVLAFASSLYNYYIFKGTEVTSSIDSNKLGYGIAASLLATSLILSFLITKILK